MTEEYTPVSGRKVQWHWSFFLLGVVYALPAVVVMIFDATAGLALAVGVLPTAAIALPATRRARRLVIVAGMMSAIGFVLGSLLTQVPVVAVVGMFVFPLACVLWARRSRAGALALALVLPLTGIALSYSDLAQGVLIAALVLAGSLYGWLVGLLWPERVSPPPPRRPELTLNEARVYGVLLGSAAALAAALGYLLHLEHVGWVTGSALLVMRPARDLLLLRGAGRAVSVILGAAVAAALAGLSGPFASVTTIVAVALALGSLAATAGSRWYIAPLFTSFLALTLILQGEGEQPQFRFIERSVETGIGVGLALLLGAVVPAILQVVRTRRHATRV